MHQHQHYPSKTMLVWCSLGEVILESSEIDQDLSLTINKITMAMIMYNVQHYQATITGGPSMPASGGDSRTWEGNPSVTGRQSPGVSSQSWSAGRLSMEAC